MSRPSITCDVMSGVHGPSYDWSGDHSFTVVQEVNTSTAVLADACAGFAWTDNSFIAPLHSDSRTLASSTDSFCFATVPMCFQDTSVPVRFVLARTLYV